MLQKLSCAALWTLCIHPSASARPKSLLGDTLPTVNRLVVEYVTDHVGRKVDRGECWDLAAAALNSAHADWDGTYGFGRVVDPQKDEILPGDIIQFEGVTVEKRTTTSLLRETYGHHTAVVLHVLANGEYTIAHQNFGDAGRKVSTTPLRLSDVRSGKITFHRPQAR